MERRRSRAVVVAVVLVVAAIVTAVQYQRQVQAPAVPAGPDDPPQGVQLFYVRDPSHSHVLVAYDWSGNRRGSVRLPTWVDLSHVHAASDGSGFTVDPGSPGDFAGYFDRLGHLLGETDDPSFTSQVWASDSRHICVLALGGDGASIVTRLPGYPDHSASIQPTPDLSGGPATLDACSVSADTAIFDSQSLYSVGNSESHIFALRLSSGKVLSTTATPKTAIVATRDGAYVAIGVDSTRIYRAGDMTTPLADLGPGLTALAFSGDGSLLLVSTLSGDATRLEALDWRTAKVAWHVDISTAFGPVLSRPSSRDFAIAVEGPDILLVHGNGTQATLFGHDPVGW